MCSGYGSERQEFSTAREVYPVGWLPPRNKRRRSQGQRKVPLAAARPLEEGNKSAHQIRAKDPTFSCSVLSQPPTRVPARSRLHSRNDRTAPLHDPPASFELGRQLSRKHGVPEEDHSNQAVLVSQSPSQALPKTKPSNECRASSWRGKVGARTECGREQDHFEPATVQEPDRRRGTPTHKQAREQASAGHSTFLIPAAFDHHFSLFPQSLFPGGLPRRSRGPSVRSISDPVVEATLNFFQSFELSLFLTEFAQDAGSRTFVNFSFCQSLLGLTTEN